MRVTALAIVLAAACGTAPAAGPAPSTMQGTLDRAADLEGVPRPLLLALAWADSRWTMQGRSVDGAYGLLHLIDRPDAPAALSLARAAQLTGLSAEALRTDAFANARGGAALLRAEADRVFAGARDLREERLGDWYQAVMSMSGADDARVADSFAAQIYRVLRDGQVADVEGGTVRLAPQEFDFTGRAIWGDIEQDLSGEYCPNGACVAWVPASTSNYTGGRNAAITRIVIHDMEGSYAGSISWFQNPNAQASAHYDIRSSDGQITQQVHNSDTAWHAGNSAINHSSIGIEHEGYAHTGTQWFTEAMYQSSAALTRWLANKYGIPKDRSHIIGHYEVPDPNHSGWYGGAGHHHDPCDAWNGSPTWHNVTACYWNWGHYMDLVTGGGGAATGTLTGFVGDACCGIGATKKPLAGATVTAGGQTVKTDSTGTYAFALPAGSYVPKASLTGYDTGDHSSLGAGYSATVTVTAGQTTWGSILLRKSQPAAAPPVVKITTPAEGAALAASPAAVRGTLSDVAVTTVKVNGKDVPAANGAFSTSVALVAGANTITVSATNAGGSGSATVHVSYAPPATGVQGRVTDVDGQPVAGAGLSLTPSGKHAVTAEDGSYELGAPPGNYTLAVDAIGFAAASKEIVVPADRLVIADFTVMPGDRGEPHVRIDSPDEGQVVDDEHVIVSGAVEMSSLRSLQVNEEEVAVASDGTFSVEVVLQHGVNEIVVLAIDEDGRTARVSVHVELAPVALSQTGCSTGGPADFLALLLLGIALPRRKR